MFLLYGSLKKKIDITNICKKLIDEKGLFIIPSNNIDRINLFGDPDADNDKYIFIITNDYNFNIDEDYAIEINFYEKKIKWDFIHIKSNNPIKLNLIHEKLKMVHGSLYEEIPEQRFIVKYLTGNEKVLEIGGNFGRSSLVIASILNDDKNLVVLESNINYIDKLKENRDINNFKFHIEPSALSKRKLIQEKWITLPSETLINENFIFVNCITFEELNKKYNIDFDTLILDCEGAFYYILIDMPEILNNIKLIIVENDYLEFSHKIYVDNCLKLNNFVRVDLKMGPISPCINNFYEVWKKQ